jgi:serine/threonine protein kinase
MQEVIEIIGRIDGDIDVTDLKQQGLENSLLYGLYNDTPVAVKIFNKKEGSIFYHREIKAINQLRNFQEYLFKVRARSQDKKLICSPSQLNSFEEGFASLMQKIKSRDQGEVVLYRPEMKHAVSYIIFPFYNKGDLGSLIQSFPNGLPELAVRYIFRQIVNALQTMHAGEVWHLDIKPTNIMIDTHGQLKIIDFDLSNTSKYESIISLGTSNFRSPELRYSHVIDLPAVDVYSLGVTLFFLATGKLPFMELEGATPCKFGKTKAENFILALGRYDNFFSMFHKRPSQYWENIRSSIPNNTTVKSNEFAHLIGSMLAFDPFKRPCISETKLHPWALETMLLGTEPELGFKSCLNLQK